jgi:NAD(P)-dependent dehydrogenase (short-subunit alcohol dehydrogenase family)
MDSIQDTVALVTGSASGIGRQSAIRFAEEGADVAVADIDADKGKETAELAAEHGVETEFFETDVAESTSVAETVEQTVETFGQLDYLHNNAGIEGEQTYTADQSEDTWEQVISVNLKGIWLGLKHATPHLLESEQGGNVVNTASTTGVRGAEYISPYVASKHGVVGLTKTAAREYGGQGMRVNAICPGPVDTPLVKRFTADEQERRQNMISDVPLGRFADPAEIASTVVWLCSAESSYVNGNIMLVDGGQLA